MAIEVEDLIGRGYGLPLTEAEANVAMAAANVIIETIGTCPSLRIVGTALVSSMSRILRCFNIQPADLAKEIGRWRDLEAAVERKS